MGSRMPKDLLHCKVFQMPCNFSKRSIMRKGMTSCTNAIVQLVCLFNDGGHQIIFMNNPCGLLYLAKWFQ